jgi:hypothetical protein
LQKTQGVLGNAGLWDISANFPAAAAPGGNMAGSSEWVIIFLTLVRRTEKIRGRTDTGRENWDNKQGKKFFDWYNNRLILLKVLKEGRR